MTSLFNRIQTLFMASAHETLDQHENPAVMARQILREIDSDRDRTRQQLVRSLASAKELDLRCTQLGTRQENLMNQARATLGSGRDDKARGLVTRAARLATQRDAAAAQLGRVNQHVTRLRQHLAQLQDERDEAMHQVQMIELAVHPRLAVAGGDAFSTALRRREQLAAYAARSGGDDHTLDAACDLLAEASTDTDPDIDARADALWATLNQETAQ